MGNLIFAHSKCVLHRKLLFECIKFINIKVDVATDKRNNQRTVSGKSIKKSYSNLISQYFDISYKLNLLNWSMIFRGIKYIILLQSESDLFMPTLAYLCCRGCVIFVLFLQWPVIKLHIIFIFRSAKVTAVFCTYVQV